MTFREALEELGIGAEATERDVRDAYVELARVRHPDHGGDSVAWDALQQARRRVLEELKTRTCRACGGRGTRTTMRRGRPVVDDCRACGGTGKPS